MTWGLTIGTFLGTIGAVIVVILLYSQRERFLNLLRKPPQRRIEMRAPAKIRVELSSIDGFSLHEIAFTKNVSHHGACALTKNRWSPNNTVQVRFLYENVRARARVAYCKRFGDAFLIGLQFSTPIRPW